MLEMASIEYHLTPFRAEKFAAIYWPIVPRVLAYGAKGYAFYRSEEDSNHFTHTSLWEDRDGFQRFWHSREMIEMRDRIVGLYDQLTLPEWSQVLERG
jgi:quinol monooxygenase YgiN